MLLVLHCCDANIFAQESAGENEIESRTPLRILYKPIAPYPKDESDRSSCVTGAVRLRIEFKSNSKIGAIQVIYGLPYGLTESAIEAAKHIIFDPETVDGEQVTVQKTVIFNFTIY